MQLLKIETTEHGYVGTAHKYPRLSQKSYIDLHVSYTWYIIFIFGYYILGSGVKLIKYLRNIYQIMQYFHKGLQNKDWF
jgi:hypothetical protein